MQFLIDDARPDRVERALNTFPLIGVTTNPTILRAAGLTDFGRGLRTIRELVGDGDLHVQVVARDTAGMLREADVIRELVGRSTLIKIPTTAAGLPAMRRLKAQGVRVTATAIYSTAQGLLATAAGVDYLAPYVNRMSNADVDPYAVIGALRREIDREGVPTRILAASFKNSKQVTDAAAAGAHTATIGADVLDAMLALPQVESAVDAFAADFQAAFSAPGIA
ncbi:fructose-6-phosphate aldolase [Actinomyces qiguomingii]|uniref:fructose-6-phosphate aldolase n=1 Tax=Actinomyces qiguomingii TaxID=2057800 RepID=UPI000CA002F8|nr:fructose-6-phosphate aldolase [Actinomyces qiguomingii]